MAEQDKKGNILNPVTHEVTTIDDPQVLESLTPSLDQTTTLSELLADARQAMLEPQLKSEFLNKTLQLLRMLTLTLTNLNTLIVNLNGRLKNYQNCLLFGMAGLTYLSCTI